jgi:hypothetical protein
MGFLDWITKRNAGQQQSVAETSQRPERAKEMYAREAAQEKTHLKRIVQMPPDQQAKVDKIKATLEKASKHIDANAQTPSPAANGNDSREAARQNITGQGKHAPALSPTSAQTGKTVHEASPAPSQESPSKTPEQPRGQTVPRPRPSWER